MADSSDLNLSFQSDCDDEDVPKLVLSRVHGHERLSVPYQFELWLECDLDQGLSVESIEAMLSEPCRFTFGDATINGVLEEVTLEPTTDPTRTTYHAILAPRVVHLSRTVRSRVFQSMTAPAIVEAVLTEHSIPFASSYLATYPASEYTVQFEESDLDFIRRLAEHAGFFFFFEQAPDSETMQLADDNRAFVAHDTHASLGYAPDDDHVRISWIGAMGRTIRPQTASLTLRDYNWRSPYMAEDGSMTDRQLQLVCTGAVDEVTGGGYHRRYGDHFKDETEGLRLAGVRAEEMMAERVVATGSLRAPGIGPGNRFETSGMPIAELEGEYVLVGLETHIDERAGEASYAQRYEAIPSDVPFRAQRLTDRPVIAGFMHAMIDGEVVSTAAPIDEHGRYKVIMPYDEAAAPGGKASRWIRMAQSSAGSGYGMHLPLHIGTEVIVVHLDGDPDRPVIASAVPNVDTMSPVVDANATQSRIKTRSNILFELEDDA